MAYRFVDIHAGKLEYCRQKTAVSGQCECNRGASSKSYCGHCFWTGITVPADEIPECQACKKDTESWKTFYKVSPTDFKEECNRHCFWFQWFDQKRRDVYPAIKYNNPETEFLYSNHLKK